MATLKLSLFDAEEIQQLIEVIGTALQPKLETAITRGIVRALRVAAKEHLVEGYTPPAAEPVTPEADHVMDGATDVAGLLIAGSAGDGPLPGTRVVRDLAAKRPRRSYRNFCRTVSTPLPNFIPHEEALALISTSSESATMMLRDWVFKGEVEGVILGEVKGAAILQHVMVHKQQVIARTQRIRANGMQPPERHASH